MRTLNLQRGFQDSDHWKFWLFLSILVCLITWLFIYVASKGMVAVLSIALVYIGAAIGVAFGARFVNRRRDRLEFTNGNSAPAILWVTSIAVLVVVLIAAPISYDRFLAPRLIVSLLLAPLAVAVCAAAVVAASGIASHVLEKRRIKAQGRRS